MKHSMLDTKTAAFACTRVFWNSNQQAKVCGRSMDLFIDDEARMMLCPRGVVRDGRAGANSLQWKSRYGSVVLTAFGSAVDDGINEHGLAAHLISLPGSEYEARDQRPGLNNLHCVQYFLDNCKTVGEVLALLGQFQIVPVEFKGEQWPQHIALEDASGDSAVLEYVKGRLRVYHGVQYTVVTNEPTLDWHLQNLKRYKLFGGELPLPGDIDPASRFVRAACFLKTLPEPRDGAQALAFLRGVLFRVASPMGSQDTTGSTSPNLGPTRWLVLYDLSNRVVYFLAGVNLFPFQINLDELDFAQGAPMLQINPMDPELGGAVSPTLAPWAFQELKDDNAFPT